MFPDPDFCQCVLTGLNIYPKLAKFGGAGTLVPITGFANSVAASAIEYQKEGQVFGIGCKIFTIGRTCDPVWDLLELGAGTDLLDLSGDCISNVR